MEKLPCITCKCDLRDCGRPTYDGQWASCAVCGAVYAIKVAYDDNGHPMKNREGQTVVYLEPARPGNPALYRDDFSDEPTVEQMPEVMQDFEDLKTTIENCESVNDFLKQIKKQK